MKRISSTAQVKLLRHALLSVLGQAPGLATLESLQADDKTPRPTAVTVSDQTLIYAWRVLEETK